MRAIMIGASLVLLLVAVPAVAQEATTEFTSLEPIENIISNFSSGIPTEGLTIESDDPTAAIQSQFQIAVNFGSDPAFAREEVILTPYGFVDGSSTTIESVAQHFEPLADMATLPPLDPWNDVYNRVAIGDRLGGWTAYGEEGIIDDLEDAFEPIQAVWGIELTEPFDTSCPETAYVGRAWEGASVTTGPDPLFTADALNGRYSGTHQALVGTASRIVELSCRPGAEPTVFLSRMKEGAGLRPFGPTGTIALVKETSVVFFSPVRIYDGDLRQQFFATPAENGPVEASIIEDEPKLLVPNPYEELDTKITIVPIQEPAGEAASEASTGLRTLHSPVNRSAIRTQSGQGCHPKSSVLLVNDLSAAALTSGFGRDESIEHVALPDGDPGLTATYPDGSVQAFRWVPADGGNPGHFELEITNSGGGTCATPAEVLSSGQMVSFASGEEPESGETEESPGDDPADEPTQQDDTPEAAESQSSDSGGIPWVPVALGIIAVGAGTFLFVKSRNKPKKAPSDSPPPTPPPAPEAEPPPEAKPSGPRTFTAEDRAALQEVYKGADEGGLKVVGISEITRLEDVKAGSKNDGRVIGKAVKIVVGVTEGGALVSPHDEAAASRLSIEAIPSVEFDGKGDAHVVWSAYTQDIDGATRRIEDTTTSGPTTQEWKAKVDGRSDVAIGNDPAFKDWKVESMPDNPADAVSQALNRRG